jgi:hypothetical protein
VAKKVGVIDPENILGKQAPAWAPFSLVKKYQAYQMVSSFFLRANLDMYTGA